MRQGGELAALTRTGAQNGSSRRATLQTRHGEAGLGLAWWWTGVIRQWLRVALPAWMTVELDSRALLFTLLESLGVALAAAISRRARSRSLLRLNDAMRDVSRGSFGGLTGSRVRNALVTGEPARIRYRVCADSRPHVSHRPASGAL